MAEPTPEDQPIADLSLGFGALGLRWMMARAQLTSPRTRDTALFRTGSVAELLAGGAWKLKLTALSRHWLPEVVKRDLFLFGLDDLPLLDGVKAHGLRKGESLQFGFEGGHGEVVLGQERAALPGALDVARAYLEFHMLGGLLCERVESERRRRRRRSPLTRRPGLDAARALAVGLVIGVHALLPFMETPVGWAIRDRPRHELVDLTVWVARSFVLPAFFWLSGFLSRGIVERRGLADFMRQRIARVGIPLLLLAWPNSAALGALWDAGRALQPRPAVGAQLPQLRGTGLAVSLGHLWFLYYLLVVSAGAVVLVLVCQAAKRAFAGSGGLPALERAREPERSAALLGPLAVALPLSALLGCAGKLQLDTPLSFAVDPVIALAFGLFFAWGWRVQGRPDELSALGQWSWVFLALALPLMAVIIPSLRESAAVPVPSAVEWASSGPRLTALAASGAFSVLTTAAFIGACIRQSRSAVTRSSFSPVLLTSATSFTSPCWWRCRSRSPAGRDLRRSNSPPRSAARWASASSPMSPSPRLRSVYGGRVRDLDDVRTVERSNA